MDAAPWTTTFDALRTLSTMAGVGVAFWGVNKWRREQIGKRQAELAEEALALIYEARDVFNSVRSPGGYVGEGSTRVSGPNESDDVRQVLNQEFVPIERLNNYANFFVRVQAIRPRVKAIFGSTNAAPLDQIFEIRNEITVSAHMLSIYAKDRFDKTDETYKQIRKHQANKWIGVEKPDALDEKLSRATEQLEELVEPILKSRYRL